MLQTKTDHLWKVIRIIPLDRRYANKDGFKFSHIPKTIIDWNNLPEHISLIEEINTFKQAISNHPDQTSWPEHSTRSVGQCQIKIYISFT